MNELIEFLVFNIINNSKEINVYSETKKDKVKVFVRVGDDDIGRIIGKKGRTAKSMRILLSAIGKIKNKKINLLILEPKAQ